MRRVRILVSAARLPEKDFVTRSHPETQKARDPWSVRGPFLLRAARGTNDPRQPSQANPPRQRDEGRWRARPPIKVDGSTAHRRL